VPPWQPYKNTITTVIIEDGVTSIGDNAFLGCSSLSSIVRVHLHSDAEGYNAFAVVPLRPQANICIVFSVFFFKKKINKSLYIHDFYRFILHIFFVIILRYK